MHTTIDNVYQFRDAFKACGRGQQFTYDGLEVLFDYLEQYEADTGESVELDVIALCCEYSEDTPEDIARYNNIDVSECEEEDEVREAVLEYLNYNTVVCGDTDTTIVYQAF